MERMTTPSEPSLRASTPDSSAPHLTPQQWWEVLSPPADLAAACGELIAGTDTLDCAQLQELVSTIAARPELWESLVVHDRERRRYRLLYEDDRIDVWVLSWMPGQGTGYHDHDRSSVGLASARGTIVERQMLLPEGATAIEMTPGVSRSGGGGYIHACGHVEGEPAVSIHAYSPPLAWVGQYRVNEETGVLERSIMHGRQELLDHTIAAVDPSRADVRDDCPPEIPLPRANP